MIFYIFKFTLYTGWFPLLRCGGWANREHFPSHQRSWKAAAPRLHSSKVRPGYWAQETLFSILSIGKFFPPPHCCLLQGRTQISFKMFKHWWSIQVAEGGDRWKVSNQNQRGVLKDIIRPTISYWLNQQSPIKWCLLWKSSLKEADETSLVLDLIHLNLPNHHLTTSPDQSWCVHHTRDARPCSNLPTLQKTNPCVNFKFPIVQNPIAPSAAYIQSGQNNCCAGKWKTSMCVSKTWPNAASLCTIYPLWENLTHRYFIWRCIKNCKTTNY